MGTLRNPKVGGPADSSLVDEEENVLRRRTIAQQQWRLPRRYVLAIMVFFVLIIQAWRNHNIIFMLFEVVTMEEKVLYPSVENWTVQEIESYSSASLIGEVCAQLPAALLIHLTSSHKFLFASVAASSILHALTPVALDHHSWTLVVVLFAQGITLAPARVAALSIWRDWAPPTDRTKLLALAFSGSYLPAAFTAFQVFVMRFIPISESFYISAVCGLVWSLFWYATISDTPSNDPLITEREFRYLQNNIPTTAYKMLKLSDVPWKSILTSKPVWTLSFVYFKVACSMTILTTALIYYTIILVSQDLSPYSFIIPFFASCLVILPTGAIVSDILTRKFQGQISNVRKGFLCGAFALHAILLLGTIFQTIVIKITFYILSYTIFMLSIPGFVTIALDISGHYISIVAGIIETFFCLGLLFCHYFFNFILFHLQISSFDWFFLLDGILSVLAAGIFFRWGSAEEQTWSMNYSRNRSSTDYQRYPGPEDEDDTTEVADS